MSRVIVLQPTAVVKLYGEGRPRHVRCLIDPGSPFSRISAELVKKLGLKTSSMDSYLLAAVRMAGSEGAREEIEAVAGISRRYQVTTLLRTINASVVDETGGQEII